MEGINWGKRWRRLPERLRLAYGLISATVFISGASFIFSFFKATRENIKTVAGVATSVNPSPSFFSDLYNGMSTRATTYIIYIGFPIVLTIIFLLIYLIAKSLKKPSIVQNEDKKAEDILI